MEQDDSADLSNEDPTSAILDIREYDVPYLARVCIDLNLRVGCWYEVIPENGGIRMVRQEHILTPSNPKVFAFDIETSKAPLKFPDASQDAIYMISIMIDGQGTLIINREIVSQDIQDFEYCWEERVSDRFTPHPDYKGPFHVFNEPTEELLLRRFYSLIEVNIERSLHSRPKNPIFSSRLTEISSIGRSFATGRSFTGFLCRTNLGSAR